MKIRNKILLASICCASLTVSHTSYAQENITKFVQSAKYALTKNFLDPDSAKFRNLEVRQWEGSNGKNLSLCGEVNGKNSMGAYIGYAKFKASAESGLVIKADDPEFVKMTWDFECGKETKLIKRIK